jgi:hypothetical protein
MSTNQANKLMEEALEDGDFARAGYYAQILFAMEENNEN